MPPPSSTARSLHFHPPNSVQVVDTSHKTSYITTLDCSIDTANALLHSSVQLKHSSPLAVFAFPLHARLLAVHPSGLLLLQSSAERDAIVTTEARRAGGVFEATAVVDHKRNVARVFVVHEDGVSIVDVKL